MESQDTIFLNGREIPDSAERAAYLRQACGDNAELLKRVEAMLRDAPRADEFFGPEETVAGSEFVTEGPGTVIGRYKLLQKIGEGGMGVVYMAEQREPVIRKVALKIIKLGMDTRQVTARFEAERQALAMMDHPNIARVLDGGATESGRPYFVMDLVPGLPITQFCDQANLSTDDRLELFLEVCSAIGHAHQKGIIHRDIKPSNILVTLHGDWPVPKVIDFGVAKATEGRLTEKTLFTQFQQFIGTPAYMSPEQVSLSGLDVDTRSDIYALGVLLYELLTGRTPFDAKELLKAGLDEMRRTIQQIEPPRPSNRLSTLQGQDLTITATQRHTDPPKLIHLVRGDLDWIVMKSLEKDRARRYETASGLAMDIKRHLTDEPITACPPSAIYRFRKMVRRNKLAFAAGSAVVIALIIGLGVSTWEFRNERAARQRAVVAEQEEASLRQKAESERAKAQAVTYFLEQALWTVSPSGGGNKGVLVRDLLDDTARKLDDGAFRDEPDVEASLRQTVGLTYLDLGALDEARPHLERALKLQIELYGEHDARVAESMGNLATLGGPTAEPSLEKAMAIQQAVFGPNAPKVADTLQMLAWAHSDSTDYLANEARYRRALEIYSKAGLENTPQAIHALHYLGLSILHGGDAAGSIPLMRQALEKTRRFGRDKAELADGLADLAAALNAAGQPADVEALYREALKNLRDSVDFSHMDMEQSVEGLTEFLKARGQPEKAEAVLLEQYALLKADPRRTPQEEEWLLQRIVRLYRSWHSEELADWQRKLDLTAAEGVKDDIAVDTEAILRNPKNAVALEARARAFAQRGRAAEAAADAEKVIELAPENPSLYHGLAALLVATDDVEGYRRQCQLMVARFAGTKVAITSDRMAKACLILPASGADWGVVNQWVETTVTNGKTGDGLAWAEVLKGLAEYRLGHFAAAAELTQKVEVAARDPGRDAEAWLVMAMARQRLNQVGEARAALAKATEIVNTELPTLDSGDIGIHWFDWIVVHTLMREANALIEGGPATTRM